jgi:CRISPR-associated endoribonuclease Cas6
VITTWAIPLAHIDIRRVRPAHVHAVAASWVDADHWGTVKPWSLSPLARVDGIVAIELTTLTDDAATSLNAHVSPDTVVRLGAQTSTVIAPPTALAQTHPRLITDEPAQYAHVVAFDTPVTFRNGSRSSPFPDPASLLRSLASRWNALYTAETTPITVTHQRCANIWISDLEGRTNTLTVGPLTLSAFVGRVRYVADDDDTASALTRLLRFAEYAGVGSYTTRGLGRIRRVPTWQPK